MRVTDRFVIRDKVSESTLRNLEQVIDTMAGSNKLDKNNFLEVQYVVMELLITLFKRLDNNTTPAKTLLDFTGIEVRDACFRVGESTAFEKDSDYVIAVMQELTK